MATDIEGRSDLGVQAMLDCGAKDQTLHRQDTQPETSIIEKCVSPSIPPFSLSDRATQTSELSSQDAAEPPAPTMHNNNPQRLSRIKVFQTRLTTPEESLGRKRWSLPGKVKRKAGRWFTSCFLDASDSADPPNERAGEQSSDSIMVHSQNEPLSGSEYHTNIQTESPCVPNFVLETFPAPQGLFMMQSTDFDQQSMQSMQSYSSEVANKYQTYVFVEDSEGRRFKVQVQFDTGAGSNFISRGTLELIGRINILAIPSTRLAEYCSPIGVNTIQPTYCCFVKMWNEELNFFVPRRDAKLKIIERPEVFQIIIGRNLIELVNNRTGGSLLARLEQLNSNAPVAETSSNEVCALIKTNRSEGTHSPTRYSQSNCANVYGAAQRAIDAAENERRHQAFFERQKILESSSSPSSSGVARYNGSESLATDRRETANQQPNSVPIRLDHHQGAARQTTPSSFVGFPAPRKTDTSSSQSTQYTQFTQYSMDRRSTTSTMSSLTDTSLYTPKKRGLGAAPRTQEERNK
jgi:hypothetical protein